MEHLNVNSEKPEEQLYNGLLQDNVNNIRTQVNNIRTQANNLRTNNILNYYIFRFEYYFSSLGFEKKQGLPLVGEDDTILFTNSAIVSLKKYVINGEKIPSYFITQPCIRLQNLNKSIYDHPLYMSSFHMIGAFISAEKYPAFIKQVWSFLLYELDYNVTELKIYCDKNHSTLLKGWINLEDGPEIIFAQESFDWKFGEGDKMRGHGFDFRVKGKNGDYEDIGNIMEIVSNGEIVGYGLGLGLETLISKKRNYINPIQFFTDNSGIELDKNEDLYLYDSIKVLIDAYRNGIKSGRNSYGYEIKKTFNKINTILSLSKEKYIDLYCAISSMEKFIYCDIQVSKIIFDELIQKSGYQISSKPFTLIVDTQDDQKYILDQISLIFPNNIFELIDTYKGENIGIGNMAITISVTYVVEKSKSKDYFKYILSEIGQNFKIR